MDATSYVMEIPQIKSNQLEADPRIASHEIFALSADEAVCVVADDTHIYIYIYIYILLLYVSHYCGGKLYFRQGTGTSKDGITYHDVKSLANHLGENVCKIMPAFHALTGCDYTAPFYGRSKYTIFKKMQKDRNAEIMLSSLNTERVNVPEVIEFILHIAYNRPKSEKTAAQCRYTTAIKINRIGKKTFKDTRRIPPDESTLKMNIMRANYVTLGKSIEFYCLHRSTKIISISMNKRLVRLSPY